MLEKLGWKEGQVLSLRLRDALYTLAQMRISPYMQFYHVFSADGSWRDVALAEQESLFCVPLSDKRMRPSSSM